MLADFHATSDLHGERINLNWLWVDPGGRPAWHLVRRRLAYPQEVNDGVLVLALDELFRTPNAPWMVIEQTLYLVHNQGSEEDLRQAEAIFFFVDAADSQPRRAVIHLYDIASGEIQTTTINAVTRVRRTEAATAPWAAVTTLEIFAAPGGGAETLAGELVILTGHADGVTSDRVDWTPAGEAMLSAEFDQVDARLMTAGDVVGTTTAVRATFQTVRTGEQLRVVALPALYQAAIEAEQVANPTRSLIAQISLNETFDMNSGDWNRYVSVVDGALAPETDYYYALFVPVAGEPGTYRTQLEWRAFAVATGHYGLSEQLYRLLPALHQQYDEPAPDQQGEGQLRRYVEIFGVALDQIRSTAETLRDRHDVERARVDLLPHLSRWIGWEPDQTLDAYSQRQDIRFAPEIYSTTGTGPNLCALVNRVTGWECRIKEFVHNVFLTNAPEGIRLWEIWTLRHDGTQWLDLASVTRTDGFDGRPAVVVDGDGTSWLFWHADRSGRRELWLQRLGGGATPQRASAGAPDDAPELDYVDESPAAVLVDDQVWLFWSSNRDGNWEIYTRAYEGFPGEAAFRLTEHAADDRSPAAVRGTNGAVWLFWQSNRRGPTDIWARANRDGEWSLPTRVTSAGTRHETPSVTVDGAGRLWLFWSEDLGDRRNLFVQVRDSSAWSPGEALGADWSPPRQITDGQYRDEAPSALFFNGLIWLFWHSNRNGQWQILSMTHDGTAWSEPSPVVAEITANKEPAAFVDGGGVLRLFWRSQRRGRSYHSRTVDTSDQEMLDQLQTFEDRSHYTYDAAFGNDDWYARGAVGLYLTPGAEEEAEIAAQIDRVSNFVESFRPVPVRFVWITENANP